MICQKHAKRNPDPRRPRVLLLGLAPSHVGRWRHEVGGVDGGEPKNVFRPEVSERPNRFILASVNVEDCRERCEEMHNAFEDLPGLQLNGDRISPVKHLVLRKMNATRDEDKAVMTEVVEKVRHVRTQKID